MYPESGLLSFSKAVNTEEARRIRASCTDPGHFATQFIMFMSASHIICNVKKQLVALVKSTFEIHAYFWFFLFDEITNIECCL